MEKKYYFAFNHPLHPFQFSYLAKTDNETEMKNKVEDKFGLSDFDIKEFNENDLIESIKKYLNGK